MGAARLACTIMAISTAPPMHDHPVTARPPVFVYVPIHGLSLRGRSLAQRDWQITSQCDRRMGGTGTRFIPLRLQEMYPKSFEAAFFTLAEHRMQPLNGGRKFIPDF
jgi:hypothetical protein